MQVFREAAVIEKKHINRKVVFHGDTGETPIYDEIINSDRFDIHPQNYVMQSNRISDKNLHGKAISL